MGSGEADGSGGLGSRWSVAAVAAVTLLAVALRLVKLDAGMWYDELWALVNAYRSPVGEILTVYQGDFDHPFYTFLAHLSLSMFGESAWAVRLPAMLFGVATVPATYLLARLVAGRGEALLAASLLAVSYHHVWFSQNARGYATMVFFAVTSTYLLIRGLRGGGWGHFAGYAVAAGLGVYTHLTMAFLVAGQALACGILALTGRLDRSEGGSGWVPPAAGILMAGVVTLGLYAPILDQVVDYFLNRPSTLRGLSTPAWAIREALRVLRAGFGSGPASLAVLAGGGLLVGAGMWGYYRKDRDAFWIFLLPAPITVVGALVARGTMYPRFFFFLIAFAFLVVARGALELGRRLEELGEALLDFEVGRHATTVAVGIALCGASLVSLPGLYRYPKQDFQGALRYLDGAVAPGDRIVRVGQGSWPLTGYYGRPYPEIDGLSELRLPDRGEGRLWAVYTFPRYIAGDMPGVMDALRSQCMGRKVFPGTVGDGQLVVCSFPPGGGSGDDGAKPESSADNGGGGP